MGPASTVMSLRERVNVRSAPSSSLPPNAMCLIPEADEVDFILVVGPPVGLPIELAAGLSGTDLFALREHAQLGLIGDRPRHVGAIADAAAVGEADAGLAVVVIRDVGTDAEVHALAGGEIGAQAGLVAAAIGQVVLAQQGVLGRRDPGRDTVTLVVAFAVCELEHQRRIGQWSRGQLPPQRRLARGHHFLQGALDVVLVDADAGLRAALPAVVGAELEAVLREAERLVDAWHRTQEHVGRHRGIGQAGRLVVAHVSGVAGVQQQPLDRRGGEPDAGIEGVDLPAQGLRGQGRHGQAGWVRHRVVDVRRRGEEGGILRHPARPKTRRWHGSAA